MTRVRKFQDSQRVARGFVYADVAAYGGQRFELNLWRSKREQEGEGVVHAGVGVNDDLCWGHIFLYEAAAKHRPRRRLARSPSTTMNLSVSSFVGNDGCAPNFVAANAPQALAYFTAS